MAGLVDAREDARFKEGCEDWVYCASKEAWSVGKLESRLRIHLEACFTEVLGCEESQNTEDIIVIGRACGIEETYVIPPTGFIFFRL